MNLSIGVDVGGTLTDAVAFEHILDRATVAKIPSIPCDQASGFMHVLTKVRAPLRT